MNEQQWLTCNDPQAMLELIRAGGKSMWQMTSDREWHGWLRPDTPGAPWQRVVTAPTLAEAWRRLREAVPGRGWWLTVRPIGETPK